jgi:hypothetical protein
MLPVLHPEILHNIIRHACKDDDGSVTSKRERQRDLAALMAVSKVLKSLFSSASADPKDLQRALYD